MFYCNKCRETFNDMHNTCNCAESNSIYSYKKAEIKLIPEDAKFECVRCDATEELLYHEEWTSGKHKFGNDFICKKCEQEFRDKVARDEAMNYLIIDNYANETTFCDDKSEVEEYLDGLEVHSEDSLNILILKIEKMQRDLSKKDFIPEITYDRGYSVKGAATNTHIIIYSDSIYRVEEVIEPTVEYDGDCTISW